jgi:hypothetical protein
MTRATIDSASPLTQETLKRSLAYDPATGEFRWLIARGQQRVGSVAGGIKNGKTDYRRWGYRLIGLYGRVYSAHRLAWLYVYGAWPDGDIDHIDGNRDNNRIENLRVCTPKENAENRHYTRGSSQYLGVCWNKKCKKWQASITIGGKIKYLGLHETEEAAHNSYLAMKRRYHPQSHLAQLQEI